MEGGCMGYPGASTDTNQSPDKICSRGWQISTTQQPAPIPGTHHFDESASGRGT